MARHAAVKRTDVFATGGYSNLEALDSAEGYVSAVVAVGVHLAYPELVRFPMRVEMLGC